MEGDELESKEGSELLLVLSDLGSSSEVNMYLVPLDRARLDRADLVIVFFGVDAFKWRKSALDLFVSILDGDFIGDGDSNGIWEIG